MTHRRSLLSLPKRAFLLMTHHPKCAMRAPKKSLFLLFVVAGALLVATPLLAAGPIGLLQTGQVRSYTKGDDGALRKGVSRLPFVGLAGGTIRDPNTGLIWLADMNCIKSLSMDADGAPDGQVTWGHAMDFVDRVNAGLVNLSRCGVSGTYSDWRLPNVLEAESLNSWEKTGFQWLRTGTPFRNVPAWDDYWTSTPHPDMKCGAFFVSNPYPTNAIAVRFVALVRGTTRGPAAVRRTGVKVSCRPGDDGDLRKGVAWPEPRFKDLGDGTVQDLLTGLVWPIRQDCLSASGFDADDKVPWQQGLNFIAAVNKGKRGLSRCGVTKAYRDWRVANIREMISLIDFSEMIPPFPGDSLFIRVGTDQVTGAWSSTTYGLSTPGAIVISTHDPWVWARTKSSPAYLWFVRGPLPVQ